MNAGTSAAPLPSPLVGEGAPKGRMRGGGRNASFQGLTRCAPASTPHPTSLRSATFSHKGRREGAMSGRTSETINASSLLPACGEKMPAGR